MHEDDKNRRKDYLKQTSLGSLARAALDLHRRSMRNFLGLRVSAVARSYGKPGVRLRVEVCVRNAYRGLVQLKPKLTLPDQ